VASEALVDANILLRLLTNQPPELAQRAAVLLERAEQTGLELVVAPFTIAEVVHVLQSVYHWDRDVVASRLLQFLSTSVVTVLDAAVVTRALTWFLDVRQIAFADAYLSALATARCHGRVVSFDRDLRRLEGIEVIAQPGDLPHGAAGPQ